MSHVSHSTPIRPLTEKELKTVWDWYETPGNPYHQITWAYQAACVLLAATEDLVDYFEHEGTDKTVALKTFNNIMNKLEPLPYRAMEARDAIGRVILTLMQSQRQRKRP